MKKLVLISLLLFSTVAFSSEVLYCPSFQERPGNSQIYLYKAVVVKNSPIENQIICHFTNKAGDYEFTFMRMKTGHDIWMNMPSFKEESPDYFVCQPWARSEAQPRRVHTQFTCEMQILPDEKKNK
jgi:hypothetical protein